MLKVFVAQHPVEAHLVRGILDAQGIPAEVQGEALYSTLKAGTAVPSMLPSVWIRQAGQEAEALLVIERFRQGELAPGPIGLPWACPGCGEQHEPQFTECWKCGAGRP